MTGKIIARRLAMPAALLLLSAAPALAQGIEWTYGPGTAPRLNLPDGITLDIQGIAPGDPYDQLKAKLLALGPPDAEQAPKLTREQEWAGVISSPPYREVESTIYLPTGGSSNIEASFISRLTLRRESEGHGAIDDNLEVWLSGPPSGQQAYYIKRIIQYNDEADQPRLSDLLADLTAKVGTPPDALDQASANIRAFRWQFDGGAQVHDTTEYGGCEVQLAENGGEGQIAGINRDGTCDVLFKVEVVLGISEDHVESLRFLLADHERAKQDLAADFAFFHQYIDDVRARSGAAPAL